MAITGITYNSQHSLNSGNNTPHGMTRVASEAAARKLWIANNSDDQIYKYSDAVAYNTKVALPSGNTQPRGFAYDTRRSEVVSLNQSGHIYRITPSTGASPGKYPLNAGNTSAEGILYFEAIDEYWVVDVSDHLFYRYKGSDGSFIATYALNSGNTDARGACHVAGEAWVLNGSDKRVYRYSSAGSYLGRIDLNSAHQTPRAMAKVGSKLFVADNGHDKIFDYTINGSPVIAAIASPLEFIVNTAITFKVRVDLATKVEVEANWEGLYYEWDQNAGELHIEGTPENLTTDEAYTIKATAADASTTTVTGVYNVIALAPIISPPTGRVKWVQGKKMHLPIPVSNKPSQGSVEGLLIGGTYEMDDTRLLITGEIPADPNFTVTSGTFDVAVSSSGGIDTENDVPFDILTTEPSFTTFTATAGFKSIALTYTKPTDARVMAAKIWKSDEAEPNDDIENWTEVGASPATISGLDAGVAYKVKMRANQAYIGTATAAQTVTPNAYVTLGGGLSTATGGLCLYDGKIAVLDRTPYDIFFFNKDTFAYDSKLTLTKQIVGGQLVSPSSSRLDYGGNHFYVIAKLPGERNSRIFKYANSGTNIDFLTYKNIISNSAQTMEGICHIFISNHRYNMIVLKISGNLRFYQHNVSNNSISLAISESFNNASSGILCWLTQNNIFHLFRAGKLEGYRSINNVWTHSSADDIQLNSGFSSITQSQVQGICYDDDADVFYLLSGNKLYVQENLLGS